MRRFILVIFVVLALVAVPFAYRELTLPAAPSAETFIEVTPGMGTRAIGALLEGQGIIRNQYVFDTWHLVRRGTLKAGEYRFEQPATLTAVYNRMVRGDVLTRTLTIPEGFNLFDIAQAVEDAKLASKESFLAATQDVTLISDLDPDARNLEGYLFPDTYRFAYRQTAQQVLAVMVRRFRQASASIGLKGDYHRVVTLASLVEKETPAALDRPLVASVLSNRLTQDMPLMTDPTVIYAAMLDKQYRGTIYQSDLKRDSAYNTYRHSGLPPGPICSPGIASLQAAMHPADSNYLYFVADPTAAGHSRFATTLEEHERNVIAYRRGVKNMQAAH